MSVDSQLGAPTGALGLEPPIPLAKAARSRAGQIGLGGTVLLVAALAVCAAHTNLLLPESVRPVPGWLAGTFRGFGVDAGTVGLAALTAASFAAYAVAIRHIDQLSGRAVLAAIAAVHALVLLGPPLLSTDIFSYQAYGRMYTTYGLNPYLHGPSAILLDGVYPFIGQKWIGTPSAYGPLFTALSAILAPLSLASSVFAYKAIAVVSSLTTVALLWNTARLRGVDPARAAALFGLNPLLVVYGVGGGHNDLLMLAATMAGVALIVQRRERLGAASLVIAAGMKLTAGLVGPFAFAGAGPPGVSRRRRDLLLGGGLAALAVGTLGAAMFGTGPLHLLGTLRQNQDEGDWRSIPGFISTRLGLGTIGHVTGLLLGVVFLCVFVYLLRRVWRGELDWIEGAAWATAALVATASSLLPWYVAWLLPLAALARDRRLLTVSLWMTGIVTFIDVLGYIPHGSSVLGL